MVTPERPLFVFEHPILSIEEFPPPGGTRPYVRLHMPDWVNVLPITADGAAVLVKQHRYGIERCTLEIPGGVIDGAEEPIHAARRELREETGYAGGVWTALGWITPNPAIQNNRTWLFLARGVERVGDPQPDPDEAIEVELHPVEALRSLVEQGAIHHALAVVTVQRFLLGAPPAPATRL